MSNAPIKVSGPLEKWTTENGATWFLVTITGEAVEQLQAEATIHKLETGKARGFGSVKVTVRCGSSEWRTSAFPAKKEWIIFIKKSVRTSEGISLGDQVELQLVPD